MASLSYDTLFPKQDATEKIIEDYLDHPAAEFVKDVTMNTIHKRSYNTVTFQIEITTDNQVQCIDVIYAITVWHVFGAYMNSMGDNLQDSNKFEFMNKLKHYKGIAVGLGNILGIDITGEKVPIDTTQIIASGLGMSVYKDTTYYDGAHDNVNS